MRRQPLFDAEQREEVKPPARQERRERPRPQIDNRQRESATQATQATQVEQVIPGIAPQLNGDSRNWEQEIDNLWSNRQRRRLTGPVAASDAAKVLDVSKLSVSQYPSLDKLLAASNLLNEKWVREGNAIVKR